MKPSYYSPYEAVPPVSTVFMRPCQSLQSLWGRASLSEDRLYEAVPVSTSPCQYLQSLKASLRRCISLYEAASVSMSPCESIWSLCERSPPESIEAALKYRYRLRTQIHTASQAHIYTYATHSHTYTATGACTNECAYILVRICKQMQTDTS